MEALIIVGTIISIIAWLWIVVLAFSESVIWGIGVLIVPCIGLIFVLTHWEEAAKPFFLYLLGAGLQICGVLASSA